MLYRTHRVTLFLSILLLLIALSACLPEIYADPDATPIAVVQANSEDLALTAQAADVTRAPTIAAFQTESAISTAAAGFQPTFDPSTSVEAVAVLAQAECRFGPGTNYGVVMSLFFGESVIVLGTDLGAGWFYIQTTSQVRCWILASLVSPPSNLTSLPVLPPPPTPFVTLTPTLVPTVQNIGTPAP